MLWVTDKPLWRRIEHYAAQALGQQKMDDARIDDTSVRRGQQYITVMPDLTAKRLLFATPERATVFYEDLRAHEGRKIKCGQCTSRRWRWVRTRLFMASSLP